MNNPAISQDIKRQGHNNPLTRRNFISNIMIAAGGFALGYAGNTKRWQIGCYTRPWAEHGYRVAFDSIVGAGFRYVGFMTARPGMVLTIDTPEEEAGRIGEEAKSRGLGIISLYGGSFSLKESVADGIAGLKRLINNSFICGSPDIFFPGPDAPEIVEDYCKVIAECCDYAADKGVRISVKPRAPLYITGRQCRSLIEKVGHKNFGLWYDPGNIYLYSKGKLNPVDDAEDVDGLVTGLSLKDFIPPDNINVTPGTGEVDFARLIDRLRRGRFNRGPMIVESLPEGDLTLLNAEAAKARIFAEELVT